MTNVAALKLLGLQALLTQPSSWHPCLGCQKVPPKQQERLAVLANLSTMILDPQAIQAGSVKQ